MKLLIFLSRICFRCDLINLMEMRNNFVNNNWFLFLYDKRKPFRLESNLTYVSIIHNNANSLLYINYEFREGTPYVSLTRIELNDYFSKIECFVNVYKSTYRWGNYNYRKVKAISKFKLHQFTIDNFNWFKIISSFLFQINKCLNSFHKCARQRYIPFSWI